MLDQPAIAPTAQRAPPSASPAQDQHLDEARLEHPRGMQDEHQLTLVLALIDLLLADSAQHLRQLADAQATGRPEQLRLLAHRFLSATQNIGAQRLSTLCLALERAAGDARVGDARQMLDEMATECTQVHAALLAVRPWY